MLRPIQIGVVQALAVSRPGSARLPAPALGDIAVVLVIGEDSIQAKRILSQWSRHEEAGADSAAAAIRRRRQLGRALLRKLLVEAAHFAPLHCRFTVEPQGRPVIRDANRRRHTAISLAHTGGWLAGALGLGTAIGIDIEYHQPNRNFAALARAAFGPQERGHVDGGGAREFYRIWTLREAMAKANGVGLSFVLDGRDHVTPSATDASHWYLHHSEPIPGLSVAVVVAKGTRGRLWPGQPS